MKMSGSCCLLVMLLFCFSDYAYSKGIFYSNGKTASGYILITSWKNLRDSNIEKQDMDYSCGSASVATILRSFYGMDVYEKDVLDEVEKIGDDGTASFSDLEQAVIKFGFKGIGLSVSFEKLKSIKIPAIVYLRYRGDDHFSVIRGISKAGTVWLGDPSWGNRKFTEFQFKKMWETRDDEKLKGKILLIIPQDKFSAYLDKEFFRPPKINTMAIELLTVRR
ncbi:hypothetical protein MNBD_GAMMA16-319 [hydrothermal vent metagenome]|uniref:Peptidase C39 domain-containing protein n=1 Tax=hydrothermal vent metagenome TaxID=652676 RepID=A0A3B0Z7P8_9ZZZZ